MEKDIINSSEDTRRKFNPVKITFNLNDGTYTGIITELFFYTDEKLIMKIELSEKTIFLIDTTINKFENYPFNRLLSQANIEYVEDLVNLKVKFIIKNNTAKNGETYSNVKVISVAE